MKPFLILEPIFNRPNSYFPLPDILTDQAKARLQPKLKTSSPPQLAGIGLYSSHDRSTLITFNIRDAKRHFQNIRNEQSSLLVYAWRMQAKQVRSLLQDFVIGSDRVQLIDPMNDYIRGCYTPKEIQSSNLSDLGYKRPHKLLPEAVGCTYADSQTISLFFLLAQMNDIFPFQDACAEILFLRDSCMVDFDNNPLPRNAILLQNKHQMISRAIEANVRATCAFINNGAQGLLPSLVKPCSKSIYLASQKPDRVISEIDFMI